MTSGHTVMSNPRLLRRIPAVALVAAVIALAGCTFMSEPEVTVLPEIAVEQSGTSPLESNQWVEAAREVDLGRLLALNSFDFTIEQFANTRTAGSADSTYFYWDAQFGPGQDEHIVYLGPTIMLPLSVTEDEGGGSAAVKFCVADASQIERTGVPRPARELTSGRVETWNLEYSDELGRIVVDSVALNGGTCDATGAR